MLDLVEELRRLVIALNAAGIDYALCGGIAVTIHGATRSTKDIDLVIRESDLDRVLELSAELGFDRPTMPMTFDAGTARERRVRRVAKLAHLEPLMLDLVLVTPVLEDIFAARQTYEWEGTTLSVVSLEGLARMKRMAGRHQDLADLEKLGLLDEEE
jgi:hypothetical protein